MSDDLGRWPWPAATDLVCLRDEVRAYVASNEYVAQTRLVEASKVAASVLSRFCNGKSLPGAASVQLRLALARLGEARRAA